MLLVSKQALLPHKKRFWRSRILRQIKGFFKLDALYLIKKRVRLRMRKI
jgi:hypothetical protein